MSNKHKHQKNLINNPNIKPGENIKKPPQNPYEVFEEHIEKQKTKQERVIDSTQLVLRDKPLIMAEVVNQVLDPSNPNSFSKHENEPDDQDMETKSDVFSKIYTSEFKSEMKSKNPSNGFWQNFKQSFTSDIFWQSVAFALVLGVILFYFNGLQPLVLNKYISQSKQSLSDLQKKYIEQTEYFNSTGVTVLSQLKAFNQNETCAASQKTNFQADTFNQIEIAQRQVLPDNALSSLSKYNMFFSKEVELIYDNTYNEYESSLSKYNDSIKSLRSILTFLNFRSSWISGCESLIKANGVSSKIQPICRDLINSTKEFQDLKLAKFDKALEGLDKSAKRCQEVIDFKDLSKNKGIYPDYGKLQLDWLSGFEKLLSYPIDLNSDLESLTNTNKNFDQTILDAVQKMSDIENQKSIFTNNFYLLDIKL